MMFVSLFSIGGLSGLVMLMCYYWLLVLIRLGGVMSWCTVNVLLAYSIVGISITHLGLGCDVKRCIAYSTVVQMFFSMMLSLLLVHCVVWFYLVVHALYKSSGLWYWYYSTYYSCTGHSFSRIHHSRWVHVIQVSIRSTGISVGIRPYPVGIGIID